ncbi:MAG: hypothetical protein GQ557_02220 [Mycoplasmataceae bacterium]|nr:hypothetical protein [Mycoplasmataceae bacterium]
MKTVKNITLFILKQSGLFILLFALSYVIINAIDIFAPFIENTESYAFIQLPLILLLIIYIIVLGVKLRLSHMDYGSLDLSCDIQIEELGVRNNHIKALVLDLEGITKHKNDLQTLLNREEIKNEQYNNLIYIGDKVKNVRTNQTKTIFSIRKGNEYQLASKGKWYKENELRKLEED